MSAVTPSANFNLSNEDWGKVIQILDENWTTLIQSAVDDGLIKKPELVGLAEEVCALVEGGLTETQLLAGTDPVKRGA